MRKRAALESPAAPGGVGDLEQLIAASSEAVLAFCRRRVGAEKAEEIHAEVQLAALTAHRAGKQLSTGWMVRVARNKVVDHWRTIDRQDRLAQRIFAEEAARPAVVIETESLSDVVVTLDSISPRYRSILVRHYLLGEPIAEIARHDGVTYGAVESAIARARAAFRQQHARQATDCDGSATEQAMSVA